MQVLTFLRALRWWLVAAVVATVVVAGYQAANAFLKRDRDRVRNEALVQRAKELGGVKGELVSERAITARLRKENKDLATFVEELKKTVPQARVETVYRTKILIKDQTKTVEVPATAETPHRICDEHMRFCADLPGGLFHREQDLRIATVGVVSPDGKVRVAKTEFHEFSPKTGEEIPTTGAKIQTTFEFTREKKVAPPMLHFRPLAGVDHRPSYALGAELVNFERTEWPIIERIGLGLSGYWKPDTDARLAARISYRFYGNVTAGLYGGVALSREHPRVGGLDVQVQLGD